MMCEPETKLIITLATEDEIEVPISDCLPFFDDIDRALRRVVTQEHGRINYFVVEDWMVNSGSLIIQDPSRIAYYHAKHPNDTSAYEKLRTLNNITSIKFFSSDWLYGIKYNETFNGANSRQKTKEIDGKLYITFGR
jgi:hypothetical protein